MSQFDPGSNDDREGYSLEDRGPDPQEIAERLGMRSKPIPMLNPLEGSSDS